MIDWQAEAKRWREEAERLRHQLEVRNDRIAVQNKRIEWLEASLKNIAREANTAIQRG
jgi:hypothetical protein